MPQNNSLDYTNPYQTANFRDVGVFINLIMGKNYFPENRLLRGGTPRYIEDLNTIGNPKTIFCLQKNNTLDFPCPIFHFPTANNTENYNTTLPAVRRWLLSIMQTLEKGVEFPLYIHCLSGRDRTGIVIASLLTICGIPKENIIEEYQLSSGTEDILLINTALNGICDIQPYFKAVNLEKIRHIILNNN